MRIMQMGAVFLWVIFSNNLFAQTEKTTTSTITSASLTEAHTIIGMQYFVVGTLAKECHTYLDKPDSFVKETQIAWLGRNAKFIDALTKYQATLFAEIESTYGKEKLEAEKLRYRDVVVAQGSAIVQQFFARGDKLAQCRKAAEGLASTYFDITPQFPLYAETLSLVQATSR